MYLYKLRLLFFYIIVEFGRYNNILFERCLCFYECIKDIR